MADALLLIEGPLFDDVVRDELVLLLDVSKRPDIERIASVWQRAVGFSTANIDFTSETEKLLKQLAENLSRTNEFRDHMVLRGIVSANQGIDTLLKRGQSPIYQPEIKSSLDGFYPSFYHPIQLGRLVRQSINTRSPQEEKSNPLEFPLGWQESSEHVSQQRFERENAEVVWQRHQQKSAGISLILGEPGSGKTTLIKHWYEGFRRNDVAVFRLRDLGRVPRPEEGGQTTRVWLLDGWDELPAAQRRAEQVAALPGLKIVTCRTASYHGEFDKLTSDDQVHYVMGMLPHDQRAFLLAVVDVWQGSRHSGLVRQRLNEVDEAWADKLWQTLQSDDKVRELAANPLLLTLIALVSPPGNEIKLPKNRAQFYQEAFDQLCKNRHPAKTDSQAFSVAQAWLVHLVAAENVQRVAEIPPRELDRAYRTLKNNGLDDGFSKDTLREVALTAGILKDYGHHYEFLHLTFQEWCLAQANLQQSSLMDIVQRYWQQPDYQEVLALTWSLSTTEQRKAATEWLIDQGYHVRIINGKERTFSGLRIALHVWRRSGVLMAEEGNGIDIFLWDHCQASELRKIAIAADSQTPSEILDRLAKDHYIRVRCQVAQNANTPAEVFTRLAADDDKEVRRNVARNPSAPIEVRTRLVADGDESVHLRLVEYSNTPEQAITWHDMDDNLFVRRLPMSNANIPVEVLTRLAMDDHKDVRQGVAQNANTPAEVFTQLAADDDKQVRWNVAGNPSTPTEVLTRLAVDGDEYVRSSVAGNANTPAEVFTLLAVDGDEYVRSRVAGNPSTPTEVLTWLAVDGYEGVRLRVARNSSTPTEVLTRLAVDGYEGARLRVAGNPSTPAEMLIRIAADGEKNVRESVVENSSSPLECL